MRIPCVRKYPCGKKQEKSNNAGAEPAGAQRKALGISPTVFAAPGIFLRGCAGKSRVSVLIEMWELRVRPRHRLSGSTRSFLLGYGCRCRSHIHRFRRCRLIRTKLASKGGPDVVHSPRAIESIADDLAERRRHGGISNTLDRFPLRQPLEQHSCETVYVALLQRAAFLSLRSFADAVAAQLHYAADGKDITRLDVLVNVAMGMQHLERRHQ